MTSSLEGSGSLPESKVWLDHCCRRIDLFPRHSSLLNSHVVSRVAGDRMDQSIAGPS